MVAYPLVASGEPFPFHAPDAERFLLGEATDEIDLYAALLQGVAYGANGHAQASMGVDAADYNGDGRLDLWVTNFQNEPRALYQSGKFGFTDAAGRAGLVTPSLPFLSFGGSSLLINLLGMGILLNVSQHSSSTA